MLKSILLLSALLAAPSAFATGTRGGGFVDYSPKANLLALKEDLAMRLRALPARSFDEDGNDLKIPAEWTTQRMADVVANLKVDSSAQSLNVEDNGRIKLLDYNEKEGSITVLASFFLYYGRDLSKQIVEESLAREVKQKLIHEVAHLFGFGDEQAHVVAVRLLRQIQTDLISCNYYQVNDGKKEYRHIAYSFASRVGYVRSGEVGTNNDDAWLDIDVARKNYVMASELDLSVGSKDLTIISGDQFQLVVDRAVDEDGFTTGRMKGIDRWAGFVPEQSVECVMPNAR